MVIRHQKWLAAKAGQWTLYWPHQPFLQNVHTETSVAVAPEEQTVLDRAMRPAADRLLGMFGDDVTITYKSGGTYDPATGITAPTETTATVKAHIEQWAVTEFGQLVERKGLKVMIPALGETLPRPDDTVTVDGQEYEVVRVRSSYSGFLAAYYEIMVAR
jgi:hypothetical protein